MRDACLLSSKSPRAAGPGTRYVDGRPDTVVRIWTLVAIGIVAGACGGADAAPDGSSSVASTGSAAGAGGSSASDAGADAPDTGAGATSAVSYDQDGPIPFTTEVHSVANGDSSFEVTAYLPMTRGPHPVVSFSCGSTQTAAGYVPYGQRLASHGIAMLLSDDPGVGVNTGDIVPNAVYVVETWLPEAYAGLLDVSRVGVAGHSRGGGVSLLAAEHGLAGKVVAWFGLDPVDNEFLMAPTQFARTDLPDIRIPTGYLGASVISNCAPAADGYQLLYPLSPSPSVLLVGQGAGHTQFEVPTACTACGLCSPSGNADSDTVLAYAVRYFTAFFARELLGDDKVGAALEGAGAPADVAAGLVTVTSK